LTMTISKYGATVTMVNNTTSDFFLQVLNSCFTKLTSCFF
jgi:hypothetical protein